MPPIRLEEMVFGPLVEKKTSHSYNFSCGSQSAIRVSRWATTDLDSKMGRT